MRWWVSLLARLSQNPAQGPPLSFLHLWNLKVLICLQNPCHLLLGLHQPNCRQR